MTCTERIAMTRSKKQPEAARPLTLREREILPWIGQGLGTRQSLAAVKLQQRIAGDMAPGE